MALPGREHQRSPAAGARRVGTDLLSSQEMLGGNSIETISLEFCFDKSLEFWLEIPPYTKKCSKLGSVPRFSSVHG